MRRAGHPDLAILLERAHLRDRARTWPALPTAALAEEHQDAPSPTERSTRMPRRTLKLTKEVLTELRHDELGQVAGALPPPTIPQTACTICNYPTFAQTCLCLE